MYRGYWERKKEALERKIKRERETGEGLHRRGVKEEEEAEESRRRRGWISNMLGQMHRPTVVCHSYSRPFPSFSFSFTLFLSFPRLLFSAPVFPLYSTSPPPSAGTTLFGPAGSLSFFSRRAISFQRVARSARVHVLSSPGQTGARHSADTCIRPRKVVI